MIACALLFVAMQVADSSSLSHERAGLAALQAGQKEVALQEFSSETKADPQHADGFYYLGLTYMQRGDYGPAIAPLKRALALNSALAAVHQPLGYSLLAQGYAAEAIVQFESANDKAGLGVAQLEIGDLPNAIANLQIAVTARPDDADLEYYLARASGLLSKRLYDDLLSTHPASPRANEAAGDNYAAVRKPEDAAAHYLAALKARPDLPGVYLALGQVYAGASRWKEAEDAFRAQAKLEPGNAEAAFRLGSALLENGDAREARVELARADALQPDMPETLYALGKAEASENHYAAAETAWKRVIELEKSGELASQAHFGLASIYRKQGKSEDAAREMQLFNAAKKNEKQQ